MEACARCGTFGELQPIEGALYCATCVARSDVGLVAKFRAAHLGRRDARTWVLAGLAPIALWAAISGFMKGNVPYGALCLGLAASQVLFWLGYPWARTLPLIVAFVGFGVGLTPSGSEPGGFVLPLIFAAGAYRDPLCQLFFKVDVPEKRLKPFVERLQHNPLSHTALVLAGSAIFLPPLWPVGMAFTIAAFSRVDSSASPPVGRGVAVRALLLAIAAPVVLFVLFVALYQVFQHAGD